MADILMQLSTVFGLILGFLGLTSTLYYVYAFISSFEDIRTMPAWAIGISLIPMFGIALTYNMVHIWPSDISAMSLSSLPMLLFYGYSSLIVCFAAAFFYKRKELRNYARIYRRFFLPMGIFKSLETATGCLVLLVVFIIEMNQS